MDFHSVTEANKFLITGSSYPEPRLGLTCSRNSTLDHMNHRMPNPMVSGVGVMATQRTPSLFSLHCLTIYSDFILETFFLHEPDLDKSPSKCFHENVRFHATLYFEIST